MSELQLFLSHRRKFIIILKTSGKITNILALYVKFQKLQN